jgi:hypothetical protein
MFRKRINPASGPSLTFNDNNPGDMKGELAIFAGKLEDSEQRPALARLTRDNAVVAVTFNAISGY